MFDELEPKRRHDTEAGEGAPEFEKLEFLPEEVDSPASETAGGDDLTFEAPAAEPPVTVDPQEPLLELPDPPLDSGDPGAGTPFELLGSSLFDRFSPDDSLDWAFDFDDDEIDDLDN